MNWENRRRRRENKDFCRRVTKSNRYGLGEKTPINFNDVRSDELKIWGPNGVITSVKPVSIESPYGRKYSVVGHYVNKVKLGELLEGLLPPASLSYILPFLKSK